VFYSTPKTKTLLDINKGIMHFMADGQIPVVVRNHSFLLFEDPTHKDTSLLVIKNLTTTTKKRFYLPCRCDSSFRVAINLNRFVYMLARSLERPNKRPAIALMTFELDEEYVDEINLEEPRPKNLKVKILDA